MVLKTVYSLMADCNVASNPEFSMLFCSSSHIFVLKISVDVPFSTHLTLLDLKHLMRKFLS